MSAVVPPGYKQTEVGVIPGDWEVRDYVSFGQVIDGDRGFHYPGAGELTDAGHCLFLNAGNVTKSGFLFSECQYVTAEKDQKLNKGKLTRGDIVLTTRGTLGNFAYFDDSVPFENARINSGMVILRNLTSAISNKYQYLVFQSQVVRLQVERLSFGSAQPQLTVKGISTLRIPLPPTKLEQERIAEALSDADALIEGLGQLIGKKLEVKQGAMQELLRPKEDWEVAKLGSIGVFTKGSGVRKDESLSGHLPCVRYGEIYTKHNDYIKTYYSRISSSVAINARRLETGDILFAGSGETKEEIGKCVAFIDSSEAYAGGDIVILRPRKGNSIFLGY